jgi:hypothetical protein
MSDALTHRARVAALTRSRAHSDPDLVAARRDLAAANLEDAIHRTLGSAPPLTEHQRELLARLITGYGKRPS